MLGKRTILALILASLMPAAGFAFPAVGTEIIHIQERFDAFEQGKYLATSLDENDRGFLVSRWGLTNISDGHFTAMAHLLADSGLGRNDSSVRIAKASLSPNKRLLALQLTVADSYSAWQTCQNEPADPNDECLSAVVVLDVSSQRLVHDVIYSARLKAFSTAGDVEKVTGEAVTFLKTEPVFSKDGQSLLVLSEGKSSKTIFVLANNVQNHRFELKEKLAPNADLHVFEAGDDLLLISEVSKSVVLSKENFSKKSEIELETQSTDYSGDWLDSQFRVIAMSKDLIALHQSAFRTKNDKSIDSRIVLLNPATGSTSFIPYRSFIGNNLNDVPESNLVFGRIDSGKLLLTSENDEKLCREIPKGETAGYALDLATATAVKIPCAASVRDLPGITEETHLPEAVDALNDDTDLIQTNLDGKELSLILKKSTSQVYQSSEPVSPGAKTILENNSSLYFVSSRDKAIFKIPKDALKVVPTTTTTTSPPAPEVTTPPAAAEVVQEQPVEATSTSAEVTTTTAPQNLEKETEKEPTFPKERAVDQLDNGSDAKSD